MERLLSRLRDHRDDDGFTLIEAVVALTVASIVFTGFAAASIGGVRSVLVGRTAQQASDVGERALEEMRALGYDSAAMVAGDLGVNDPVDVASCSCYNPADDSVEGDTEPLDVKANGGVTPHVTTETINETAYTVRRYVTVPEDASGAAYKRLTVVVTWSLQGKERSRTTTSAITEKRSGLPLPDFKWVPEGAVDACLSSGATQVFGFTLKNNGARDSWTISSSGGSTTWDLYRDTVGGVDGEHDGDDVPLVGGVVGPIDPNRQELVWAVGTPTGSGTSTVSFTATSVAQPTYAQSLDVTVQVASTCSSAPATASASASVTPTPTSTTPPPPQPVTCTGTVPSVSTGGGVTPRSYYLTNGDQNLGSTTASSPLPISRLTPPTSTTLWNYSTDLASGVAGRHLATTGSTTATTVEWQRQMPSSRFTGNGVLSLWAGPASGLSSEPLVVRATVRQLSSTGTVKATFTNNVAVGTGAWACGGLKQVGWSVPFGSGNGTTFAANDVLSVRLTVSGANALVGYDTTAMPSQLTLPVKSGG